MYEVGITENNIATTTKNKQTHKSAASYETQKTDFTSIYNTC